MQFEKKSIYCTI